MVPLSKQMPTVIRPSQIGTDVTYEPPLRVGFGITDQTVNGAKATMGRTVLVPGAGPNPTHYHTVNDVCWYISPVGSRRGSPGATVVIARR